MVSCSVEIDTSDFEAVVRHLAEELPVEVDVHEVRLGVDVVRDGQPAVGCVGACQQDCAVHRVGDVAVAVEDGFEGPVGALNLVLLHIVVT